MVTRGRVKQDRTTTHLDLRIECTAVEPADPKTAGQSQATLHTFYVGPGRSREDYLRQATTTYARGAVFGRHGADYHVVRCVLVTTTTVAEEISVTGHLVR